MFRGLFNFSKASWLTTTTARRLEAFVVAGGAIGASVAWVPAIAATVDAGVATAAVAAIAAPWEATVGAVARPASVGAIAVVIKIIVVEVVNVRVVSATVVSAVETTTAIWVVVVASTLVIRPSAEATEAAEAAEAATSKAAVGEAATAGVAACVAAAAATRATGELGLFGTIFLGLFIHGKFHRFLEIIISYIIQNRFILGSSYFAKR